MATRPTGPGTSVRRSGGSGDSNLTGHSESNLPRIIGSRKLEADYYAQRAAEAEARRLGQRKSPKGRNGRNITDPQRMTWAGYVIWLHDQGYKPRDICKAFDNAFNADFVNKVQCCATCIDAVAIEPPPEIIERIRAMKKAV